MLRGGCVALLLAGCGLGHGDRDTSAAAVDFSGFMGGTIGGGADFQQSAAGVSIGVYLENCVVGKAYPVFILDGASCATTQTQGGHWDMTRGEGIPSVVCNDMGYVSPYTRDASDPSLRWTVDEDLATDVEGHVVVVQDADDTTTRVACGSIYLVYPI